MDERITQRGHREYTTFSGHTYSRRIGAKEWLRVESSPETEPELQLSLVIMSQSPGEPNHWCLFVAYESKSGQVYQVTGDAELMTYEPEEANVLASTELKEVFVLAAITGETTSIIEEVVRNETPPRAISRAAGTENCQGWTIRVIQKLITKGIVDSSTLSNVLSKQQSV